MGSFITVQCLVTRSLVTFCDPRKNTRGYLNIYSIRKPSKEIRKTHFRRFINRPFWEALAESKGDGILYSSLVRAGPQIRHLLSVGRGRIIKSEKVYENQAEIVTEFGYHEAETFSYSIALETLKRSILLLWSITKSKGATAELRTRPITYINFNLG